MIYDRVPDDAPLRQGDIFASLPRVDVSLKKMYVIDEDLSTYEMSWANAAENQGDGRTPVRAILPLVPVDGIVVTQTCDAARAGYVSLCEIVPIRKVLRDSATWTTKKWAKNLTKQDTESLRWFYLPPEGAPDFREKMAVDFRTIIHLAREDLDGFRQFRKVRLNEVAYEHFREKLAQFFRRYPYNPWYPLNKEEFSAYAESQGGEEVKPYDWQQ
jgi:hypothetical protein